MDDQEDLKMDGIDDEALRTDDEALGGVHSEEAKERIKV